MSQWQLVTVVCDGTVAAAVKVGDEVYRPAVLDGIAEAIDVVRRWNHYGPLLRAWHPEAGERVGGARLVQPLRYPSKILCSGPNFTDHLAEMGEAGLGDDWTAYFFFKPATTTLIGDGDVILVDDPEGALVDWEGELAVVIGEGGRRIPETEALAHVAGYAVANDISLRGPHHRDTPARPFQWDWVASKAADTSLPFGPGIVPAWQVPDVQALRIRTSVNGDVRQDGTTASMVLTVAQLIAQASALTTLESGDVILTGTPAGVGAAQRTFLAPGDEVVVTIDGVGTIRNTIQRRDIRGKESV